MGGGRFEGDYALDVEIEGRLHLDDRFGSSTVWVSPDGDVPSLPVLWSIINGRIKKGAK